jgi:HD-like signal output (HDOD) protein
MIERVEDPVSSEIRDKAEKLVRERFRYVSCEEPVLEALVKFGVDRVARDMADRPEAYTEDTKKDEIPRAHFSDKSEMPLGPLELLINEINLPALPQVLIELLRVINDPNTSAKDLAAVVSLDTSLSSYLLRVVNSAYYNFPFPIDTVTRAVILIGTRELSVLAFSTSFLNLFRKSPSQSINIEQFWKHSIACGITARILARRGKKKNPERHFVAGLLHDIGRLAIFGNIPQLAEDVLAVGREKGMPFYEAEQMVLGFDHARFGGSLLRKWNFPSTLVAAVLHHHVPHMGEDFDEPGTVHLADIIAKAMGVGLSGDFYVPAMDPQAWNGLELCLQDLSPIIQALEEELESTFRILVGMRDLASLRRP